AKWVRLFNGKDLSGWRTHPDQPGSWRVEEGLLVGRGPQSHLFSGRGDFENFHLRVEVMINNGGGNGGVFCSPLAAPPARPKTGLTPPATRRRSSRTPTIPSRPAVCLGSSRASLSEKV